MFAAILALVLWDKVASCDTADVGLRLVRFTVMPVIPRRVSPIGGSEGVLLPLAVYARDGELLALRGAEAARSASRDGLPARSLSPTASPFCGSAEPAARFGDSERRFRDAVASVAVPRVFEMSSKAWYPRGLPCILTGLIAPRAHVSGGPGSASAHKECL